MQKSFASEKIIDKIPFNPEENPENFPTAKSINYIQIQQGIPIPEHKKLSNYEFEQTNLNANSSSSLTE